MRTKSMKRPRPSSAEYREIGPSVSVKDRMVWLSHQTWGIPREGSNSVFFMHGNSEGRDRQWRYAARMTAQQARELAEKLIEHARVVERHYEQLGRSLVADKQEPPPNEPAVAQAQAQDSSLADQFAALRQCIVETNDRYLAAIAEQTRRIQAACREERIEAYRRAAKAIEPLRQAYTHPTTQGAMIQAQGAIESLLAAESRSDDRLREAALSLDDTLTLREDLPK